MESTGARPIAKHLVGALDGLEPGARSQFEWTLTRALEELPEGDVELLIDGRPLAHWLAGEVLFTAEASVETEDDAAVAVLDVRSRPLVAAGVRYSSRFARLGAHRPGLRTSWRFFDGDDELRIDGQVVIVEDDDPKEVDAAEEFATTLATRLGWPERPE